MNTVYRFYGLDKEAKDKGKMVVMSFIDATKMKPERRITKLASDTRAEIERGKVPEDRLFFVKVLRNSIIYEKIGEFKSGTRAQDRKALLEYRQKELNANLSPDNTAKLIKKYEELRPIKKQIKRVEAEKNSFNTEEQKKKRAEAMKRYQKKNPEVFKEATSRYRAGAENRDKINKRRRELYAEKRNVESKCRVCGELYKRSARTAHLNSAKHLLAKNGLSEEKNSKKTEEEDEGYSSAE